jgi:hypothetical protein
LVQEQSTNSSIPAALEVIGNLSKNITEWFIENRRHAGLPTRNIAALLEESDDEENEREQLIPAESDGSGTEAGLMEEDEGESQKKAPKKKKTKNDFMLTKSDGTLGTVTTQFAKALQRSFKGLSFLLSEAPEFPVHLISTLRLENLFGTMRQNASSTMYPTALEYIEHYSSSVSEYLKKTRGTSFYFKTHRKSRRYQQQDDGTHLHYGNDLRLPRKKRARNADILDASDQNGLSTDDIAYERKMQKDFRDQLWTYLRICGKPVKSNRIRAFSKHAAGTLPDNATYFHRDGGMRRVSDQHQSRPDEQDKQLDPIAVNVARSTEALRKQQPLFSPPLLQSQRPSTSIPKSLDPILGKFQSPYSRSSSVASSASLASRGFSNSSRAPTEIAGRIQSSPDNAGWTELASRTSTPTPTRRPGRPSKNPANSIATPTLGRTLARPRGRPRKKDLQHDDDTASTSQQSIVQKRPGRPRKKDLQCDDDTASTSQQSIGNASKSSTRPRKLRSPNRRVPVNEIVYRRLSIVEDRRGTLYILKGAVTREPGMKTLRPADVPAIALIPHAGSRLSSISEWKSSNAVANLKTSTISQEICDISLTSAGLYTRLRGQGRHFSFNDENEHDKKDEAEENDDDDDEEEENDDDDEEEEENDDDDDDDDEEKNNNDDDDDEEEKNNNDDDEEDDGDQTDKDNHDIQDDGTDGEHE